MNKFLLFFTCLFFPVISMAAEGTFVAYNVDSKAYEGYYVSPAKGSPFVLLIHDWDGLTDYEVKRADMLKDLGYSVFAADLFGKGVRPTENEERKALTGALYADREEMRKRIYAALEEAKQLGANIENGIAAGYCFGGAAVLEFARSGVSLKGFVTFHGGLTTPEGQDYSTAKGSFLILHGSADTSVTLDDFASLGKQIEAAGITHELISYSGAPHAFTVFDSPRYREDADKKSWRRFTEYLEETLQ